jgi:tRNA-Thr(GGU) m(6)t(6)A37 methyltransferase TsaA
MISHMVKIQYKPIGYIRSPFHDIADMPIQPGGAKGIAGTIEINPQYTEGLRDLKGFSHVILIYHFHLSKGFSLKVKPFLDKKPKGVFATRAPKRPNPVGISIVRLKRIKGNILHIENIDVVDRTPLLDIKPYVPEFDAPEVKKIGWLSQKVKKVYRTRSDKRFGSAD